MTPDRSFERDYREDVECLAHRARIVLPDVIRRDGTASAEQFAVVPPGVDLEKAFLPHREIDGPPSRWTGAAIVGTREPDIAPYIADFGSVLFASGGAKHISRPQSRDKILSWLYDMTGYRYAPAAFWKVAGWEIGWAANFLYRCHAGGAMGELIVAERQAAAAVRAMWIVHDQSEGDPLLLEESGGVLAGRALVDMAAAFGRYMDDALGGVPTLNTEARNGVISAQELVVQRLRACVGALLAADRAQDRFTARRKLGVAIDHARALVDAIGLFTVASEPAVQRVARVSEALARNRRFAKSLPASFAETLTSIASDIETVSYAQCPDLLRRTTWCDIITAGLDRLQGRDAAVRGEALALVRTDLIYKLIVTRRLDRLFEALPWMAAPSGAFPLTFGGPLGAAATLFEAGRTFEIGSELKRRLDKPPGGPRLDTRWGTQIYGDPARTMHALKHQTRAGFLLASSALSHAMVQAYLAGGHFDDAHPLPTLAAGRMDWNFQASMLEPATMATVTTIELEKTIYATSDYDRDLPRYMGMTLSDVFAAPLIDMFSGAHRDPGFAKFTKLANARRKKLKQGQIIFADAGDANRELLRSVLKSLDSATDGSSAEWRDEGVVAVDPSDVELRKFDRRHAAHSGLRDRTGGSIRRRASKIRADRGSPGRSLAARVKMARTWLANDGQVRSDDQPLAELLAGRLSPKTLIPQAQECAPVLWFLPSIDSHIHDWVADGASMSSPPALVDMAHAKLISEEVQAVRNKLPWLFGMSISPELRRRVLIPIWTGLAGITEDHVHAR